MKKNLIYMLNIIVVAIILFSCESTLDRSFIPANEISFIKVETQNVSSINPNDDSGLDPVHSTFIGSPVTFSSTTADSEVAERVWSIPQPDLGVSGLATEVINDLQPVTRSFNRANNPSSNLEDRGFPIVLIETLNDGTVTVHATNIQVRDLVAADFLTAGIATIDFPTNIKAVSAAELGLSSSDLVGENQVFFEWNFGTGYIETAQGRVSQITTNDVNRQFNVIFDTITPDGEEGELVTFTVVRNYPLKSSSTVQKPIKVVAGLTPNRGAGKDPMKLSADGSTITIGYDEAIGDISGISGADYEIIVDADEITDSDAKVAFENITITDVALDPTNPNNLLLTLSTSVPSILMDNVKLTFTSKSLFTQSGVLIDVLDEAPVFQTGENLLTTLGASNFEDSTKWKNGNFFFPIDSPEVTYSSEQAFDGNSSFLFQTTGTPIGGIGAAITEFGLTPSSFPVATPARYILSMWVYVESAEDDTNITFFLLDYADFSSGSRVSNLPTPNTGRWIKITGERTINPSGNIRMLIRVVNPGPPTNTGVSRIFIDQAEMRIVDDGR